MEHLGKHPKILMLNSSRGFIGGVERLMVNMAETLKQHGWQVYGLFENTVFEDPLFDAAFEDVTISKEDDIEQLITQYKSIGIQYVCIHKTNHWKWVKTLQKHFLTVVIVHDHDYYCLRRHKYYPVIRKNCFLPFSMIYCSICAGMIEKKNGKISLIDLDQRYRMLQQIRKCDLSFVLSDYMKHNLIMNGWDKRKIKKLIPYQPIVPINEAVNNTCPIILYVGQLVRGKGVDLLLQSLSLLSEPFQCKIVGQGNDKLFLEELACELKLNEKVEFVGWTANVSEIYDQADIVVVPSRWQEPFGLVGLEAFAHKKPVVAFANGGIPQWLKHKVNGLLVRPGDYAKFAIALKTLLNDKELRLKYGKAGYQMVERDYNFEKYSNSLLEPLAELIGKNE